MQLSLLAAAGWPLDLAFFLILLLGTALGAYKGFVKGVCSLAGKVASLVIAVTFCVSFANFLELCFHMTTAIANGIAGAIVNNEALAVGLPNEITGAEIEGALKAIGVEGFPAWFIALNFKNAELIPAGTTAAAMIGSVLAKWISIVISFVVLILIVRLGAVLLSKGLGAITSAIAPLRVVDQVLGALLGLAKACVWIFILLLICNWLPIDGLHDYIRSSGVVGAIFDSDWFQAATSYAVSGQWLTDLQQPTA